MAEKIGEAITIAETSIQQAIWMTRNRICTQYFKLVVEYSDDDFVEDGDAEQLQDVPVLNDEGKAFVKAAKNVPFC